eukprot:Awhi_evm1s10324
MSLLPKRLLPSQGMLGIMTAETRSSNRDRLTGKGPRNFYKGTGGGVRGRFGRN